MKQGDADYTYVVYVAYDAVGISICLSSCSIVRACLGAMRRTHAGEKLHRLTLID